MDTLDYLFIFIMFTMCNTVKLDKKTMSEIRDIKCEVVHDNKNKN